MNMMPVTVKAAIRVKFIAFKNAFGWKDFK